MQLQAKQPTSQEASAQEQSEPMLDVRLLTSRMKQGDEMAYRTFYDSYYHRLWRYLLVVSAGDEQASAEALQATLVRVVRYLRVFDQEEAFWGWLSVLARTALSDQRRGRRRYLGFLDRFTRHTETTPAPTDSGTDAKLLEMLETNLGKMSNADRELLEAKYFERNPVREIARRLGTTEKAIESRLVRLRQKLKAAMLEEIRNEQSLR